MNKGKPRLLEANPNCGWSYDAHMQRMSALGNINYSDMLRLIIESCQDRITQDYKVVECPFFSLSLSHCCTDKERHICSGGRYFTSEGSNETSICKFSRRTEV